MTRNQLKQLYERLGRLSVSVLPDFFADRILYVRSIERLFKDIRKKAVSGGGSLREYQQKEIKGGNATNLAFALSLLSLRTNLFVVGDETAKRFTSSYPRKCKVKVIPGRPGYTLAIEFPYRDKRVNVMISDVGDLAEFSGDLLDKADLKSIAESSCAALVNWSSNNRANDLAEKIFSLPNRNSRLNFLDPADLTGAEDRIVLLIERIFDRGLVDVLSINENESRVLSNLLSTYKLPWDYSADDIKKAARSIYDAVGVKADIHTPLGSASGIDGETFWADSFGTVVDIVTGAGDVWDAGDITGYLLKIDPESRLRFANACAYLYLNSEAAAPPTFREVVKFVEKRGIILT